MTKESAVSNSTCGVKRHKSNGTSRISNTRRAYMASTQIKRRIGIPSTDDANKKRAKGDSEKDTEKSRRKSTNSYAAPSPKKPKHENDARHFKFTRKRAFSLSGGNGKYLPLHKRRKKEGIIPPTKFLLGGNIYDPLNLNSLQDEEINRAVNAVTPRSSPLPTPRHRKEEIQVLIPPNIHDPLNLAAGEDGDDFELKLVSPKKRKGRRRRRHAAASPTGESKDDLHTPSTPPNPNETTPPPSSACAPAQRTEVGESIPECAESQEVEVDSNKDSDDSPKEKDKRSGGGGRKSGGGGGPSVEERKSGGSSRKLSQDAKDKIVSPVVPQPGARKRPPAFNRSASRVEGAAGTEGAADTRSGGEVRRVGGGKPPPSHDQGGHAKRNFNKKSINYQYGNYNRYYGYRNPSHSDDNRLQYLRQDLFEGKDVLDIGCNVGHITLVIARDLGARSVIGMDIDKKLIEAARNNVRHYVGTCGPRSKHRSGNRHPTPVALKQEEKFPASMPILYGPIDAGYSHLTAKPSDVLKREESKGFEFPQNVQFVQGNYVLDCDLLLETEQPKFDVILCLSVTKWIHLNWGDDGLKRAFRRMFMQLRPGGKLILEPQAWASYKKKKNITETVSQNYHRISLFPQKFTQYLLSEVGFRKCEVLGMPQHPSKGFQRPIQLFYKDGTSPRSDCGEGSSLVSLEEKVPSCASPMSRVKGECKKSVACADGRESVRPLDISSVKMENFGEESMAVSESEKATGHSAVSGGNGSEGPQAETDLAHCSPTTTDSDKSELTQPRKALDSNADVEVKSLDAVNESSADSSIVPSEEELSVAK
ncbi:7SK snRNA methylphosphate capping enzyme bin3-like isoform X2 [Ischnura elegans]|uniref:7SK snRNA methylphosphate capping enzyme bin3-like isoform X2 n=1 Tax=Ischnura elegans TaxID=197161 RepID=UPI001ED8B99B|nr:7SK snRNA methylphosphate capping enzyme bin3-like isoform X2 [Ischnura elegans]